jgi:hypothetical protein
MGASKTVAQQLEQCLEEVHTVESDIRGVYSVTLPTGKQYQVEVTRVRNHE